jgi:hypothetical protein
MSAFDCAELNRGHDPAANQQVKTFSRRQGCGHKTRFVTAAHVGPPNTAGADSPARHRGYRPPGQAPTWQQADRIRRMNFSALHRIDLGLKAHPTGIVLDDPSARRNVRMRRIRWLLSLGAFVLSIQFAMASEPCASCGDGNCRTKCRPAPAYALAPGCCEVRRHCFDNAWDGYCEERAHWDTFWCKVGTGALYPCTPCRTHDGRGVALEVRLRPAAAACGCHNCNASPPVAGR